MLDAVFSLDSLITAVGMVDHLAIMMMAVVIAIGIMLIASKPLTRFVNAHPTVVVLCLGFLLEGDVQTEQVVDATFRLPRVSELLMPILSVVPLQMLAYFLARDLGREIDQPRNLAKSVTVE